MATYYTGVPVGGTLLWFGGLVGLPIPDNFILNIDYNNSGVSNPRVSSDFNATGLPSEDGNYLQGAVLQSNTDFTVTTGSPNSFLLSLAHVPRLRGSHSAPTAAEIQLTSSEINYLFSIGNDNASADKSTSSATEPHSPTVKTTLYSPIVYGTGWNSDTASKQGGSGGWNLLHRPEGASSGINQTPKHSHSSGSTQEHSHYISFSVTNTITVPTTASFNEGVQEPLEYNPVTDSVGVLLITRIF